MKKASETRKLELKHDFCNICQKKTDQEVKEYPDGTVFKCSVCKSTLFEPVRKIK